jgi:hypothetical protein
MPGFPFLIHLKRGVGWQDGSAGKGTCHQAWLSEFSNWDTHGIKRKLTPESCSLTCIHTHTHTHTQRERERERERETDRHTERERQTQRERQRDRDRKTETDRQTDRQTHTHTHTTFCF